MREGRVYFADGNAYFNRPGPRLADSAEMLAEMLHPEVAALRYEGQRGWQLLSPFVGRGSRVRQTNARASLPPDALSP